MKRNDNLERSIDRVKSFWDSSPLFSGEFEGQIGSEDFFTAHEKTIIDNIMGGKLDKRFVEHIDYGASIIDIGCGPGFWVRQFCRMGLDVHGCDLSTTAVELTKKSLSLFNLQADIREANAEDLPYEDNSFDYINCQGDIHHNPDTPQCIREFYRILKPGGLACFSVYHQNVVLGSPFLLRSISLILRRSVFLKGRGRENILRGHNPDELVRLFDGKENPIGKSFTVNEIVLMLDSANLTLIKKWKQYFPSRVLPAAIPCFMRCLLNDYFGLLVVFLARKPYVC